MQSSEKAKELGCGDSKEVLKCLCANKNFAYGLRDCAAASCSGTPDKIVAYGLELCKG